MSYHLKILRDHPIGFWPLDESSGTVVTDISGCGNNGTYVGSHVFGFIPLVSGGNHCVQITNTKYITIPVDNDYYGSTADGGFADYNSSDNDFTLETWIYPNISGTSMIPLMADDNTNIGIYYQNGNIVFMLESERLDYTLEHISKAHHIVATYTTSEMSLTVDGNMVKKSLSNFKFTNAELDLVIGPTNNSTNYFLVDAPAVYRYALTQDKILEHMNLAKPITPDQVAFPDQGTIFSIYDDGISAQYRFAYPANKRLEYLSNEDLVYDSDLKCLKLRTTETATAKTVVIEDVIAIPYGFELDSSKIEWDGTNGITVRTKVGDDPYQTCINGRAIPQFKLVDGSFSSNRILGIEITFTSSDASKYNPKLFYLSFSFYNKQKQYSSSNGDYIYTLDGLAGATDKEITAGRVPMTPLLRDSRNGLRTGSASGFRINSYTSVKTLEFFFTPSSLGANTLFSSDNSSISWNGSGVISKTNIAAIYVNGVDKSSQGNVASLFVENEISHVIIVLTAATTGDLKFNYGSSGGPSSLYQYIVYYSDAFTSNKAQEHYNLFIGRPSLIVDDSSMTVTENEVAYYNNNWIVVQSV